MRSIRVGLFCMALCIMSVCSKDGVEEVDMISGDKDDG